jgi:hypothetical protein
MNNQFNPLLIKCTANATEALCKPTAEMAIRDLAHMDETTAAVSLLGYAIGALILAYIAFLFRN